MSFREKWLALQQLGVDRVLCIRFNDTFRKMTADAFVRRVLVEGLACRHMVVGDDLHFGCDRRGDYTSLKTAGEQYGFSVERTPTLLIEGERVSSTRIRQALANAQWSLVTQLLGGPYCLSGRVVVGQRLGARLGIPTLNVPLKRLRTALSGVYVVSVTGLSDATLYGVANIGVHPTVAELPKPQLEVHVFDYCGEAYGRRITVAFHQKIRDEQQFSSVAALKQQIEQDIKTGQQQVSTIKHVNGK